MRNFLLQILIFLILIGCKNDHSDSDKLIKVSRKEQKEKFPYQIFSIDNDVLYRDYEGNILKTDSIKKITNWKKIWAQDLYKDNKGELQEIVLRKPTKEDVQLNEQIQNDLEKKASLKIQYKEIDCSNLSFLLKKIDSTDQAMRNSGDYNQKVDEENLNLVINILNQCGMPNWEQVSRLDFSTIWLVLQHANKEARKTYFPVLKKSAENGDLRKKSVAMMEDRMMMDYDKPQIYGTQVYRRSNSEPWKLYDLKDPEHVDSRRRNVGLNSLSEYLENFGIDFQIKQEK